MTRADSDPPVAGVRRAPAAGDRFGEALRGHTVSVMQSAVLALVTLAATAGVVLTAGRAMSRNEAAAS